MPAPVYSSSLLGKKTAWPVLDARDGPASLQFLDASGRDFGPAIDVPFQSKSFFNVNGTFFALKARCFSDSQTLNSGVFNYSVCCSDPQDLDWMPSIDDYGCGQIESTTTFLFDDNSVASNFRFRYDLADAEITAKLLDYSRNVFESTAIFVNHDNLAKSSQTSDLLCRIPTGNVNSSCVLKMKSDLFLDLSFNLVVDNRLGEEYYGGLNGRIIRRNDTFVTPFYQLYTADSPCWTMNETIPTSRKKMTAKTTACCTIFRNKNGGNSPGLTRSAAGFPVQFDCLIPMAVTLFDCCRIFLSVLLPPVGVFLQTGCDVHLAICILLTLLGYFPGYACPFSHLCPLRDPQRINLPKVPGPSVFVLSFVFSPLCFTFRLPNMPVTAGDCCRIFCSVIIPPIGVFMQTGCSAELLICIILTLLGYIPGLAYAIYIIASQ
uniref:Uncharacterized protein n=1 Tax=Panagrolaimus sp. JU765 TaxID=591449 RepID=A0AC34QNW8_9BILA